MRWKGSVTRIGNVKTSDSCHLLCETSVVKPTVSGGLQCKGELIMNSTDRLSRNSKCEASKVSNACMGSMVSRSLNQCEGSGLGECKTVDCSKGYNIRFVYNSNVIPKQVDALLARRPVKNCVNARRCKSRNVWCSMNAATKVSSNCVSKSVKCDKQVVREACQNDQNKDKQCQTLSPAASTDKGRRVNQVLTAKVILIQTYLINHKSIRIRTQIVGSV